ncbi:hypothetical protein A7U60_g2633 [Sanghuangporus baumii]|uniref:Uncharacterized protein n=1 Tax=Sanghuangporus baumii TaxID=108892 RepID=A0A9Q5I2U6_SANBA|nr:hypothetical protein A7U60_g2633 [Sanghuangporus baumii]
MARSGRGSDPEYEQSEYEDDVKRRSKGTGGSGTKASRWIAVLLIFIAFVFMAFAAATPVTEKFYLFSVKVKVDALIIKVTDDFQFGVWGYCSTGVKNSFGIGKAKINTKLSKGGCEDRKLGWTFKDIMTDARVHIPYTSPGMSDDVQDAISAALTSAFVLHVVAAVTLFPALIAAMIGAAKSDRVIRYRDSEYREKDSYHDPLYRRSDRVIRYRDSEYRGKDSYHDPLYRRVRNCRRVFICVLIAMIFTGIVFVLDVAGVVLTKDTVHDKSKGLANLDFGPAFWFVVVAFALILLAFFIAVVDLAASGRSAPPPLDRRTTVDRPPRSEDPSTPSRYSREDDDRFYDVDMNSPQDEKRGRLR